MSTKLAKIEKRTAYLLILPSVLLVFSIILFPIFSNIWISFKNVELKDLRIPEPRAKKLVKSIKENPNQIKVIYKLRNSSLTCLLYTSPSPRDISGSRMPSSA